MKKAIITIKGKQYKVSEGDQIKVNLLQIDEKNNVDIDGVNLYTDEKDTLVGNPFLTGVDVELSITGNQLGKKVVIKKFNRRKRYYRTQGHRQKLTGLKVEKIINK